LDRKLKCDKDFYFKYMLFFRTLNLSRNPQKYQPIRMISEGSCDTRENSNKGAEKSVLPTQE